MRLEAADYGTTGWRMAEAATPLTKRSRVEKTKRQPEGGGQTEIGDLMSDVCGQRPDGREKASEREKRKTTMTNKNFDLSRYASGLRLGDKGIWFASAQEAVLYPSEVNGQCFQIEDKLFWFKYHNE